MRIKRFGSIGLGSVVAVSLSWAGMAFAQDAATEEAAPAEAAPAEAAPAEAAPAEAKAEEGEEKVEELYVTGSRIKRMDLSTPAPVTVISREELDASGLTSVGDILQRLPAQSNATNTKVNNGGDGSTRINIRGLGSSRTLILVNGRRFVPGGLGANSSVDLNSIPMSVIERVEVLKDGASAVYGSDAIAGVVNIITKESIEGITADAYAGMTQDGKGMTMDVNVTGGTSFDGGNVWASVGYYSQGSLMAGDRDFSQYDREYAFGTFDELGITSDEERVYIGGSSAPPWGWYNLTYDPENPGSEDMQAIWETYRDAETGEIPEGTSTVVTVGEDGQLTEFNFAGSRDAPGTELLPKGDRYNYQPDNYMLTPSDRIYAFSAGNFDIAEDTKAFFEASYTIRTGGQKLAPTPLFAAFDLPDGSIPADQPFNILNAEVGDYRHRMVELGTRDYENAVKTMRFVAGVEGMFGEGLGVLSGWDWGVSANYGRTDATTKLLGNLYMNRTQHALKGCVGAEPEGAVQASDEGEECVPYNPFPYVDANTYYYDLPENADELARLREYLLFEGEDKGYTTQLVGLAEM
ncbi:MAG: TonB-dependent receptor plug domain-containing protein, partial [Myxococcota bacterium]|nr:TonB-dependent receptor plug domain-containing protein [Myxococcota bacterium]